MEMVITITRLDEEIPQKSSPTTSGRTMARHSPTERTKRKKSYSPDTMPTLNFDEGKEGGDDT